MTAEYLCVLQGGEAEVRNIGWEEQPQMPFDAHPAVLGACSGQALRYATPIHDKTVRGAPNALRSG